MGIICLLKSVHNHFALLAAWFRLIYTAIFGIALYHLVNVLQILSDNENFNVFTTEQLHAEVMGQINAFNNGWLIGLVFFGFHLLAIGYLLFKLGSFPSKLIGTFLMIASAGYVIDSTAHFLLPTYTDYKTIFMLIVAVPGVIGELSFAIWLLVTGTPRNLSKKV